MYKSQSIIKSEKYKLYWDKCTWTYTWTRRYYIIDQMYYKVKSEKSLTLEDISIPSDINILRKYGIIILVILYI